MLLSVVVFLARTSHQPASRTLPTCLQACLRQLCRYRVPPRERGVHAPERRSSHDRLPPYKTSCAVPVRQKTVRVLAEEMYPLTTNQHRSRPSPSS